MEYQIMPDTREKEKIVGGHFTLTQTIFLALGLVAGGGGAIMTFKATNNVLLAIIVLVLLAIPFLPFAFVKVEKMGDKELFFYLLILFKYSQMQKVYINLNENKRNRLLKEYKNKNENEE